MDAFEEVVCGILRRKGYWVRQGFKVELTKAEKAEMGIPSSPRWELDVLAYQPRENALLVVECKSYLNSPGVSIKGFKGPDEKHLSRYKLFNRDLVREVVFRRLEIQLVEQGMCARQPSISLYLAAGQTVAKEAASVKEHFAAHGWTLWDRAWLRTELQSLEVSAYEDDVAAVVAKLLKAGP